MVKQGFTAKHPSGNEQGFVFVEINGENHRTVTQTVPDFKGNKKTGRKSTGLEPL